MIENPRCKLSIRNIQGLILGHFEAQLCRFSQLYPACREFEKKLTPHYTAMGGRELQVTPSGCNARVV
jgi:hypothetical protein